MSGQRNQQLLLDDMIEALARLDALRVHVPKDSAPAREQAEMILWNLTVLGEAAKRMPNDIRENHPEVRWSSVARTRDVVVHHYEGIDWEVIRDILWCYVPELRDQLIGIRDTLKNPG